MAGADMSLPRQTWVHVRMGTRVRGGGNLGFRGRVCIYVGVRTPPRVSGAAAVGWISAFSPPPIVRNRAITSVLFIIAKRRCTTGSSEIHDECGIRRSSRYDSHGGDGRWRSSKEISSSRDKCIAAYSWIPDTSCAMLHQRVPYRLVRFEE